METNPYRVPIVFTTLIVIDLLVGEWIGVLVLSSLLILYLLMMPAKREL